MPANIGSMFYAGEKPWHGLGTAVFGELTAEDAILQAGLDWKVEKRKIYYSVPGAFTSDPDRLVPHPDKSAILRMDNYHPLSIMGDNFTPIQNKDAFRLMDAVLGEVGAHYHTAGCLDEGQIIWLLAKLPGEKRIVGDDIIHNFLLLVNSHDGTYALRMLQTDIRVVCQNTMQAALEGVKKENTFYARHNKSITTRTWDIKAMREKVGLIMANQDDLAASLRAMTNVYSNKHALDSYFAHTLELDTDKRSDWSKNDQSKMDELFSLFHQGTGNDMIGVRGTLYAAYNAVTEYVDYGRGRNEKTRAKGSIFGVGAAMRQRAYDKALTLV